MARRPTIEFPFTDNRLEALRPPERGELIVYDRENGEVKNKKCRPYLALRVTSGGSKVFVIYRRVRGLPRKIRLGAVGEINVKEARIRADELNAKIGRGEEPAPSWVGPRTLGKVFADYLHKRAKIRKRTWRQDEEKFRHHLERYRNKAFDEIDKEWVGRLHRRLGERSPIAANRLLALLSALFTFERGRGKPNPCRDVDRYPERERTRRLSDEELSSFAAAIDQYEAEGGNPTMAAVLRVLLWTGQRRGNVYAMRWRDLDLGRRAWTIPGEFFKNGQPHVARLPELVVEILRRRLESANGREYVFPGRGVPHVKDVRRAWWRVLEMAEIDRETTIIHDLRATFATKMAENNENIQTIADQLGHRDLETTRRYVRLADKAVAQAVDRTAAAMNDIIRPKLKESA